MTISFNKADANATLANRVALKSFIEKKVKKEGYSIDSLIYVFCSDKYLLKINKDFLLSSKPKKTSSKNDFVILI